MGQSPKKPAVSPSAPPLIQDPPKIELDLPQTPISSSTGPIGSQEPLVTRIPPATSPTTSPSPTTPGAILQVLLDRGTDIDLDRLERFMGLQREWEAEQARKAFLSAMAEFKANAPHLEKRSLVDFQAKSGGSRTHYKYADLEEVATPISHVAGPLGLSFRWVPEQRDGRVFVTTLLEHVDGHVEKITLNGPLDDSGNKNVIQQVGSTITYLSRYGLLQIFGMAVQGEDDDGRKADADKAFGMGEDIYQTHTKAIESAPDLKALETVFKEAYKAAGEDLPTRNAFIASKNERKAALLKGVLG